MYNIAITALLYSYGDGVFCMVECVSIVTGLSEIKQLIGKWMCDAPVTFLCIVYISCLGGISQDVNIVLLEEYLAYLIT